VPALTAEEIDKELASLYQLQNLRNLQVEYQQSAKERELVEIDDELNTLRLRKMEDFAEKQVGLMIEPFARWKRTYQQQAKAGRDLVEQGYKQPGWLKTPLNYLLGTAGYVLSPLTAAGTEWVKKPVKQSLEGLKIYDAQKKQMVESPEMAEFLGQVAEEAFYSVPFGSAVKAKMLIGKPGLKSSGKVVLPTQDPKSYLRKGELKTERLSTERVRDITTAFEKAATGKLDESKRIFTQVTEALNLGDIMPESVPAILKKYNLNAKQFADMYAETISESGRLLGLHGALAKRLKFAFKGNQEALEVFDSIYKKNTEQMFFLDRVMAGWYKIENVRRALLVSQTATAMRNAWSQVGRITIGGFDDALQSAGRQVFGIDERFVMPKTPRAAYEEVRRDFGKITRVISGMGKNDQDRLLKILDESGDIISKMRMLNTPVHEVGMGKIAGFVNTLNRMQEFFFRRIGFESKLRQELKRAGLDYNTVDPKKIPDGMIEESVNYALEMTFAANPKSKAMQKWIKAWITVPGLSTINPFPRFHYGNAIPFLVEHSPLGYLHALKPSTIKKLASGNADDFAKYASRATIGTAFLDSAIRLRQSEYAGERWYEIKYSEDPKTGKSKTFDTRPFAPLSTYLFLAEHWVNPDSIKPIDYGKAAIGFNRIAGTGLTALDWFRSRSSEKLEQQAKNFMGQYIASFLTPTRQFSDFYSGFDEEEAIFRDYKESPVLGPLLMNLPKYSQLVPEKPSPVKMGRARRGEPIKLGRVKIPAGWWRQFTGLSIRTKTVVERELDKIGMDWRRILPPSGIPAKDRAIAREMGPQAEMFLPFIINNENYKKLPVEFKRDLLAGIFGKWREAATKKVGIKRFDLILMDFIRKQKESLRKQLEKQPKIQELITE
jgi:hypothetical protein